MERSRDSARNVPWLDAAKGLALLWIVLNHLVEALAGGAAIGNPDPAWPPFAARVAQLLTPAGHGPGGAFATAVRDIGWLGDEGVGVFLVVSGLGLGWSLARNAGFDLGGFVRRRLGRIYPPWLVAHGTLGVLIVALGKASPVILVLSAIGIRFLPATYEALVPAWWFIGLLLQLYATVPLLFWAAKRFGPGRMAAGAVLIGLAVRALGWNVAGGYLDEWSRGAIFITRLPEFACGFALAWMCAADPARLTALVRSPRALLAAAVLFVAGNVLALSWTGMIVAPFVMSLGATVLIAAALSALRTPVLGWCGRHSYALFITHQFAIMALVRPGTPVRVAGEVGAALALGLVLAIGLEALTGWIERGVKQLGTRRSVIRAAGAVAAIAVVLYGAEAAVRTFDPMETLGWGERPSLVADPVVTWKLRPNAQTRLRWESYDYTVTANALGFPAPAPPRTTAPGVLRVMTVGNAFTSAEGVDTPDSWPRLLERDAPRLAVSDFAITGHGPNQEAAVVRAYGPVVRPDVVLVQLWVKDFGDALLPDTTFQDSIGFDNPSPNGVHAFLTLASLRAWIHLRIKEPLLAALKRQPNPEGYFLGGFQHFLVADDAAIEGAGYARTLADVRAIRDDAAQWGGRVVVVMVPASIQVCRPDQLPYYPKYVDFADRRVFDPERPQRLATKLARALGVQEVDLRDAFRDGACVFAPHNMHWTRAGQADVAAYLAHRLSPTFAAIRDHRRRVAFAH